MAPRLLRTLAACLVASILVPPVATADADPASDILLGQSVFYPFSPSVSGDIQRQLNAEVSGAARAGLPIKVALIGSPVDLGAVPNLFGKPQTYAKFLDQEISFQGTKQPLLVVMPAGYGVSGLSAAATAAAPTLPKPPGSQNNDLARAAMVAVQKLAAAGGHPIRGVAVPGAASSGGSSAPVIIAILAAAAVATASAVILFRRRQAAAS
jgi:hypothetical protein